MPQYYNELGTGQFGSELETADEVRIYEVARDPGAEYVTNPLIENELRRHPGIDAPEDTGERILPRCCGPDLSHEVPLEHIAADEPLVSLFEQLQSHIRR
jgi:hypothetical protein